MRGSYWDVLAIGCCCDPVKKHVNETIVFDYTLREVIGAKVTPVPQSKCRPSVLDSG